MRMITAGIIATAALTQNIGSMSAVIAAADPAHGVSVTAITVAADYAQTHTVYAVAQLPNCQTACAELLRSPDGGASWTRAMAQGWQPGGLTSVRFQGGAALVAWSQNTIAMSLDGGDRFTDFAVSGTPTYAAADGAGIDVMISSDSGSSRLALPQAREQSVRGAADLASAAVSFTTAYPAPPPGVPAAIALGVDRTSGTARLEPCDASLSCAAPIPVPTGGAVVSSPAFMHDLTFFLLGAQGLERSTDGGRSLAPITVMEPGPQTVITTVSGLAFSPDFDAVARRGVVYAGVISATKTGHSGSLSGGVFRSGDTGTTWTRIGAAADLATGVSALAMAPDGRLFAGAYEFGNGAGGVYCNAGGTWRRTCPAYASPAARTAVAGTAPVPPPTTRPAVGAAGDNGPQSTNRPVPMSEDVAARRARAIRPGHVTTAVALGLLGLVGIGGIVAWTRRRRPEGASPME